MGFTGRLRGKMVIVAGSEPQVSRSQAWKADCFRGDAWDLRHDFLMINGVLVFGTFLGKALFDGVDSLVTR